MPINSLPITLTTLLIKDIVELSVLTYACYRWLRWLQADTQKPLLRYFYAYCILWIASSFLHLDTILLVLQYSMPLTIMLFILVHQHTLQKNFVGLYKVKPTQRQNQDWLQHIIGFCLQSDTNLSILLEHTTTLTELIHIPIPLCAPISRELLSFISQSTDFDAKLYLVANTQGDLLGANATWKHSRVHTALNGFDEQNSDKSPYYLLDSDGCMIHYMHKTRTFTMVIKQNIYPALTAAQVLQSIEYYMRTTKTKQGILYEAHHSSSSVQPPA